MSAVAASRLTSDSGEVLGARGGCPTTLAPPAERLARNGFHPYPLRTFRPAGGVCAGSGQARCRLPRTAERRPPRPLRGAAGGRATRGDAVGNAGERGLPDAEAPGEPWRVPDR